MCALLGVVAAPELAHPGNWDAEQIVLNGPHPDQATLETVFAQAAADYGVPAELLKAIAFVESRWVHTGPTIDSGFGIMHLVNNSDAATLIEAAELTGRSVEDLKLDPIANIQGGAALLAHYVKKTVGTANTWEDYAEALKRFSGLNESVQGKQALEYLTVLANGASGSNSLDMDIQLAPVGDLDLTALTDEVRGREVAADDYGPAIWNPAASCNYGTSRGGQAIDRWVNHWVGTGTYAGAISWFKNCNAEASAHFVIRKSDGELTQMVRIAYRAWHCGNWNSRSIGIEHDATPSNPWPTASNAPMLVNSAAVCRHFCNVYGIPKTRSYIIGHNESSGASTSCPGPLPWSTYMSLVEGAPPIPAFDATYNNQSYPSSMTAGTTAVVWAEFVNKGSSSWSHCATKLGTSSPNDRSSPFCNIPNWACADGSNQGCTRPTDVDQSSVTTNNVGRFTFILKAPTTPGVYVEKFRPVQEGVTWFGPEITWTITVTAANGNLTGTVTNASTSAPIAGATVTLSGIGNATTNGSGVYTFNNVAAGNYTVSVTATSFSSGSSGVTITAGATATKNFALTPVDSQAPTVPQNLAANATGPSTVQLTWDASTDNVGVAGYDIRRNGTVIGSSATNSYTDNTAPADTTLTYDVRAKDAVPNYSAYSNTAQATTPPAPPSTVTIFSDGFNGNLDNWTQQVGGYAYSTTVSRGGVAGGGAAYMAAGETDQMFHTFTRPFAQCKAKAWFYDGKGGYKASVCGWAYRTGMSLRDINNAAGVYLDNEFYNAPDQSKYYFRIIGTGGVSTHTAYATRDANTDCAGTWVGFETEVIPTAVGGTCVLKVTDRSGTQSTTQNLTTDFFSHGIGRFTLGLGVSSANEGYWDDAIFEANPPIKPDMDAPTVLSDMQIKWNFSAGDNNHFGWDVLNEGGSAVSPSWPNAGWLDHAATSWTEAGLTPNTVYTRKVKCWNGTLDSAASITQSARTLSATPNASSVTPSQETVCSGADVVWTAVGGFGAGKVEYYHYAWDQSPTHTFNGTEEIWSSGLLTLGAAAPGNWYLHLQGFNADDVPNGNYAAMVVATGCDAPTLVSAVSRKTHAAAGVFDLNLGSSTAVESRTGGPTQVLVTFSTAIAGADGLDNADVAVSSGSISNVSIAGDVLTISLAGVTDGQKLSITFPGIVSSGSGLAVPAGEAICFGVLSGDVSGDGVSNVFDLVAVRNALNQVPAAGNYRSDVTGDGAINVFDLVAVRNNLNKSVSGTCPGL